jgi:uncharacterized protein YecE (DUF72 family)
MSDTADKGIAKYKLRAAYEAYTAATADLIAADFSDMIRDARVEVTRLQHLVESTLLPLQQAVAAAKAELERQATLYSAVYDERPHDHVTVAWRKQYVITDEQGAINYLRAAGRDDLLRIAVNKSEINKIADELLAERVPWIEQHKNPVVTIKGFTE